MIDILVIGMGISGLYFGLKTLNKNKNIVLVDKSEKVGGRLKSIKIDNETEYYAEGGAQRFFINENDKRKISLENDNLVKELLDMMNIRYTEKRNDILLNEKKYEKIYKNIKKYYPSKLNKEIKRQLSLPSSIIISNQNDIEISKLNIINEFTKTIGYDIFKYQINLDMAYNTLDKITSKKQNFVNGGYENLCVSLYNIIKKYHKCLLNYNVFDIKYDHINNIYIINNSIKTKKIVYTGTISQLENIKTNIKWLPEIKRIIRQKYILYPAIKIFIKLYNPFWSEYDYFKKINTDTLLNQIIFFNKNTILIYSNMENSKTLYNLDRYDKFEWTKSGLLINTCNYIVNIFYKIFNTKIIIKEIAYRYHDIASMFSSPISNDEYFYFHNLLHFNNFHFISGDYTDNPGWVNSCLYSVNINLNRILD